MAVTIDVGITKALLKGGSPLSLCLDMPKIKRDRIYIPGLAFKYAIIAAGKSVGDDTAMLKQSLFVEDEWIEVNGVPEIERMRIGLSSRQVWRLRWKWSEWSINISMSFDRAEISEGRLRSLLRLAGDKIGVFEGRPERSAMGYGRWELVDSA